MSRAAAATAAATVLSKHLRLALCVSLSPTNVPVSVPMNDHHRHKIAISKKALTSYTRALVDSRAARRESRGRSE